MMLAKIMGTSLCAMKSQTGTSLGAALLYQIGHHDDDGDETSDCWLGPDEGSDEGPDEGFLAMRLLAYARQWQDSVDRSS